MCYGPFQVSNSKLAGGKRISSAYVDDPKCGFYFPDDGRVNPADVTQALAGCQKDGVKILETSCARRDRQKRKSMRRKNIGGRDQSRGGRLGMWG